MDDSVISYYDNWADQQLKTTPASNREAILKWKAVNLGNLYFEEIECICEIGGAEGIVLNVVGELLNTRQLTNYELSAVFCDRGRKIYPHIRYINSEFHASNGVHYDLIILSDIIEHVQDESQLLDDVRLSCKYVLLKIPVEKCLMESEVVYWLKGRKKPADQFYGPKHYNGHLRGYTIREARARILSYFEIIDSYKTHVSYFYGSKKQRRASRILSPYLTIALWGGALFILGKSRSN